jgi:hypothetical protein
VLEIIGNILENKVVSKDLIGEEFSSILASPLGFLPSLDHFSRSIQHRLRNRQTDLLGRFQIDHELKLGRLLDRQIGGLGSLPGFSASKGVSTLTDDELKARLRELDEV